MAAVTVTRVGERLIAVKQVPADRAAGIEREAELLRRVDHPGILRFVDLVDTPDGGRALHTHFVSSDTWATRPLTDPAERAAGMAALAAVVADLHDLGVAHRRLTAAHVLHGENDRPVLCGLSQADEATPDSQRADLAALADLCHDETVARGALSGRLSSLADGLRAGRLDARDLARRLDQLLAKKGPTPPAAGQSSPTGPNLLQRVPRKAAFAGSAALAAVALAAVLTGFWSRSHDTPLSVPSAGPAVAGAAPAGGDTQGLAAGRLPVDGSTDPTNPAGTGAASAAAPADPADPLSAGADRSARPTAAGASAGAEIPTGAGPSAGAEIPTGAGPSAGAEILTGAGPSAGAGGAPSASAVAETAPAAAPGSEAGAVIDHRGRRYAVGAAGDFVVTGDWDCDGEVTPAIVRPGTGDVVLFEAWPGPGGAISMPVRWQVDSPTGAEADNHGPCDLLRVFTAAGSQLLDPGGMP